MAFAQTPVCDFGRKAVEFDALGTDGMRHGLASSRGPAEPTPSVGCPIKWKRS